VALGQSSSVIFLKNNSFFETSVISFSQKSKNVLPFSVATWNFLFIFLKMCSKKLKNSQHVKNQKLVSGKLEAKRLKLRFWMSIEFQKIFTR
jgi:hypothetical protein